MPVASPESVAHVEDAEAARLLRDAPAPSGDLPARAAEARPRSNLTTIRAAAANLRFALAGYGFEPRGHVPPAGHRVPEDFAGICVASGPDAACDDYAIARLRDMGLRHVRLDYTYGSGRRYTARFLERLLDESFRVLLHLVQPREEARAIETPAAQARWRGFVAKTLDRWGDSLEAVEVGSTVNRRTWSGYTVGTFPIAWRIAHDEARKRGVRLAGPNVTDFEPVYSVAFLSHMRATGALPDVHSVNLFAERATEPEAYDHKILGHALAPLHRFNVVKKARLMHSVSRAAGLPETWSSHVAWSKRRIRRILADADNKQADYLARYLLLTAASGALSRVYWGPMIGQREGVIDDGTGEYPEDLPRVTIYERVFGDVERYRVRPALRAMRTFAALIPGARYEGRRSSAFGLEAHAFSTRQGVVHALWTMNSLAADPASLYSPSELAAAEWISRDGEPLTAPPTMIAESPCYARWRSNSPVCVKPGAAPIDRLRVHRPAHRFDDGPWRGVIDAADQAGRDALLAAIAPDRLKDAPRLETLRDARNCVWRIADPRDPQRSLVVKRFRTTKWHKKVFDALKPSKAKRSWNGACELIRRGISTPAPVAFFEHKQNAVLNECFYICAYQPTDLSVRKFFAAYGRGKAPPLDMPPMEFYQRLARFLLTMHKRGAHYRDLSAGNILVSRGDDGGLDFCLIDTARARFFNRPATMRERLADLKRICHPLDWRGREAFMSLYLEQLGRAWTPMQRLPFSLYDLKHALKQRVKRGFRLAGHAPTAALAWEPATEIAVILADCAPAVAL